MLILIHTCQKDREQYVRLGNWLSSIGPFPGHSILIGRSDGGEMQLIPRGFDHFETIDIHSDGANRWPDSANHAFKLMAKHVAMTTNEPFLWIEPDAVPMRANAFDEFQNEYNRTLQRGKYFLGQLMTSHPGLPKIVPHMSGIGVYPKDLIHHAGTIFYAIDEPWDIVAAPEILPRMMESELLLHQWKGNPFASFADVQSRIYDVRPKCALYHADKSGTLIQLLENLSSSVESRHATIENRTQYDRSEAPSGASSDDGSGSSAPPTQFTSTYVPWRDRAGAQEEIRRTVEYLKKYCGANEAKKGGGSKTRSVQIALHDAGIIKLTWRRGGRKRADKSRQRKHKGWKKKPASPLQLAALAISREKKRQKRLHPQPDNIVPKETIE